MIRSRLAAVGAAAAVVVTATAVPAQATQAGPLRPAGLRTVRIWTPGNVTFYGLERWIGHSAPFSRSAAIIAARGYHAGPYSAAPRGWVRIVTVA